MENLPVEAKPTTTLHREISLILLSFASSEANPKCIFLASSLDQKLMYTCQYVPAIPIISYIERISSLTLMTDEALIASLIYIDRIIESKNIVLTQHEMHR